MTRDEIEALRRGDVFYRADEMDGVVRICELKLDCPKLTSAQLDGVGPSGRRVSYSLPATVPVRHTRCRREPTDRGRGSIVEAFHFSDEVAAHSFAEARGLYFPEWHGPGWYFFDDESERLFAASRWEEKLIAAQLRLGEAIAEARALGK